MSVKDRVKAFITSELLHDDGAVILKDEASLLEGGVLDSLGIVRLLGFLEEEYGVAIRDEDVVPENFESVSAIVALVERAGNGATRKS